MPSSLLLNVCSSKFHFSSQLLKHETACYNEFFAMLLYVYFEIDVNSATYVGTLIFILNSDSY